jgi:hypothetical protein
MNKPQEYVFLIGAARSGTKFLRDILAESTHFRTVPFDVNYVWRYGQESRPDDMIPREAANDKGRRFIGRTLDAMARHPGGSKGKGAILEKTVSNVLRVPYIHALFPGAHFIHLIRDGRDVAESIARMWVEPLDYKYLFRKLRYFPLRNLSYAVWFLKNQLAARTRNDNRISIWGPRYPGIEQDAIKLSILEVAAHQWVWSIKSATNGLAEVPAFQQVSIRYEDLISNVESLEPIFDMLKLEDRSQVLDAYQKQVRRGLGGRWRNFSNTEQSRLYDIETEILTKLGYIKMAEQS